MNWPLGQKRMKGENCTNKSALNKIITEPVYMRASLLKEGRGGGKERENAHPSETKTKKIKTARSKFRNIRDLGN